VCRKRIRIVRLIPHTDRLAFSCHGGAAGVARYDAARRGFTLVDTFETRGLTDVTPDSTGRYVAVADESGTAYLYDTGTRLLTHYDGNAGQSSYVAPPAPDFAHVLIGAVNGTVRVWDAPGRAARVVLQAPDAIFDLAFTPDGKSVVSGGADRVVRRTSLGEDATTELGVHFSMGDDGRLLVGSPAANDVVQRFKQASPLTGVVVLAGDHHVVTKDAEGAVWDVSLDGELTRHKVRDPDGATVTALRASADGSYVATGTDTGVVTVYDASTWSVATTVTAEGSIRRLEFDPRNRDLLIASEAGHTQFGHVQILALGSQRAVGWRTFAAAVRDIAYAPDGETMGFVCADGGTWLYSTRGDTWIYTRDHDADTLTGRFSPDGRWFVSGDRRGVVIARDVEATLSVN
jgi:WD40 repeat protein